MLRCWFVACAIALAACRFGFDDTARDGATDSGAAPAVQTLTVPLFSTSSVTFADVPGSSVELPAAPGTRFLILTSAQIESTLSGNITVEARYLIDDVERGLGGTQNSAPARPGPWMHADVLDGDAQAHTLRYQLREASGGTATIHDLSALVIPLPADRVTVGRADEIQDVNALTEVPQVPLSLGALSGEYTFILVANASDAPGSSDVYVQWRGPAGEIWQTDTQNPREPFQSQVVFAHTTLDSPDAVVTMYSHVGSSGPSHIGYVRAIAIRDDAFASVAFDRDDDFVQTMSSTPMFGAQLDLAPDPTPASSYLYLSSLLLDEGCDIATDAERAIHIVHDQSTTLLVHSTDNCAYETTYGTMQLLPNKPTHVAVGYARLSGDTVDYKGSQVLVVGLR